MSGSSRPIMPDVLDEGRRLIGALAAEELMVRLLGGLAIRLIAAESFPLALERQYKDIDLATSARDARRLAQVLADQGYEPNKTFNLMHGARRLLFYDEPNERQLDVFVGRFEMCHTLPIVERLNTVPTTLPGADLLLTKLQIVKLNVKDRTDLYALLLALEVAPHDRDAINSAWVARQCARDWGLYRTVQMNLERLREEVDQAPIGDADRELITHRVDTVAQAIEVEPKGSRWKLRARVGDKVRWYEDPEEVDRHGY